MKKIIAFTFAVAAFTFTSSLMAQSTTAGRNVRQIKNVQRVNAQSISQPNSATTQKVVNNTTPAATTTRKAVVRNTNKLRAATPARPE